MARYKILYIHQDGLLTGSAISLKNILAKIDRGIFEPIVILCSDGPLRNLFESLEIKVFTVKIAPFVTAPTPVLFSKDYFYNVKTLLLNDTKSFKQLLNKIKPDIVHINDKSALIAGRVSAQMGYKTVWHLRSSYAGKKSYLQYLISRNIIKKNSNYLIAISEDETDGFENNKNLSVVNNSLLIEKADEVMNQGSTFRQEFNIKRDEIAVGMFGNLDEKKGAWNFLKSAGLAKKMQPEIKFKFFVIAPIPKNLYYGLRGKLGLIDTTNPCDKAIALAKKYNIFHETIFTDRRTDTLNIMAGLDIVTACYNLHAIGRPGFEAAAVGTPVIVNLGHTGRSSIVKHNLTGICVEKEKPVALAHAIVELAGNRSLRKELGESGIKYARQNFDSDKNVKKIEAIYLSILNEK